MGIQMSEGRGARGTCQPWDNRRRGYHFDHPINFDRSFVHLSLVHSFPSINLILLSPFGTVIKSCSVWNFCHAQSPLRSNIYPLPLLCNSSVGCLQAFDRTEYESLGYIYIYIYILFVFVFYFGFEMVKQQRSPMVSPLDLSVQIPYHFRCPISLDLMRDPVILSTGQTYDRSSIEKWLASGNSTCPVTMQRLEDSTLIPNNTLRRLIQEWCVANSSRGIQRIPTPKQPADPQKVRSAIHEVASATSTGSAGVNALRALKVLAKESDMNRMIIAQEGIVPVLISLLFSCKGSESHPEKNCTPDDQLQEEALGVLVLFPLSDSERRGIAQPHSLAHVSSLLLWGSMEVRVNAASLIESLTASDQLHELRAMVGATSGIMEGLVKILREPLYPRALKVGIRALFSLCFIRANRDKAIESGAPEALIERLVDFEKCDAERALATIELLCRSRSGCTALSHHALTVPVLVKTILKVSERATEYAAGALLAICSASGTLQKEAVQAGILTQLLLLVQSDCTDRAKRKAQMLLKLLHHAWPDELSIPDFGHTNVVPF